MEPLQEVLKGSFSCSRTLHVVVVVPYVSSLCFSDVSLPEELNARLVVGPTLNCEDLDSALHGQTVWRGGLETFVAQDQTFKRSRTTKGRKRSWP